MSVRMVVHAWTDWRLAVCRRRGDLSCALDVEVFNHGAAERLGDDGVEFRWNVVTQFVERVVDLEVIVRLPPRAVTATLPCGIRRLTPGLRSGRLRRFRRHWRF